MKDAKDVPLNKYALKETRRHCLNRANGKYWGPASALFPVLLTMIVNQKRGIVLCFVIVALLIFSILASSEQGQNIAANDGGKLVLILNKVTANGNKIDELQRSEERRVGKE